LFDTTNDKNKIPAFAEVTDCLLSSFDPNRKSRTHHANGFFFIPSHRRPIKAFAIR